MNPRFIDTDDGMVNLDHVVGIKNTHFGLSFYGPNGTLIGNKRKCRPSDIVKDLAPIIPAAPGFTAIVMSALDDYDDCGGGRPVEVYAT
jgi:hypothetical protein